MKTKTTVAWQQQPLTGVSEYRTLAKTSGHRARAGKRHISADNSLYVGGFDTTHWSCDPVRSQRLVTMMCQRDVDDDSYDMLPRSLYPC